MKVRRPKSIITNYRPPTAGNPPPLERSNARPGAAASQEPNAALDALAKLRAKEATEHDQNVRDYDVELALAAFEDVRRRKMEFGKIPAPQKKDYPNLTAEEKGQLQERWWVTARFCALARLLMKLNAAAA